MLAFSKITANAAFPQERPPAKWIFWLDAVEDSGAVSTGNEIRY